MRHGEKGLLFGKRDSDFYFFSNTFLKLFLFWRKKLESFHK